MNKPEFVCDEETWNELTVEEQEHLLDFAEECGAERKVFFPLSNPDFPGLRCVPHVNLGSLTDENFFRII